MAEIEERPPVRKASIIIERLDEKTERSGRSLDDVLRVIIWDLMEVEDWSTAEAARRLGIKRSRLSAFLDDKLPGTSISLLTAVCIALRLSPDQLFQSYEEFTPEARATIRYAEDIVFDRFRAVLKSDQARVVLDLLDEVKRRGVLDETLAVWAAQFPKAKRQAKRKKA